MNNKLFIVLFMMKDVNQQFFLHLQYASFLENEKTNVDFTTSPRFQCTMLCSRQMYGFCLHKQMDHFFQMVFLSHVIIISSCVRYFTISYESVQGFYLTSLFTMDHFGPKERKNVCNLIFLLFLDLAFLLKILIYFS